MNGAASSQHVIGQAADQLIAIIRTMRRKDVDDILRAMGKLKE